MFPANAPATSCLKTNVSVGEVNSHPGPTFISQRDQYLNLPLQKAHGFADPMKEYD